MVRCLWKNLEERNRSLNEVLYKDFIAEPAGKHEDSLDTRFLADIQTGHLADISFERCS
jgi:hypothetical protein